MTDYDFTTCLSPLDFELLSKDLLEAELGIQLENFSEGRDKGIDLRYAPIHDAGRTVFNLANFAVHQKPPELIVQCKRYSEFSDLKSSLKKKELPKIQKLHPTRYILTTSVSLTPQQADEIKAILSPFVQSTGDIYGRERLNSLLAKHPDIERRHIKLWVASAGVLDSIINAGTHVVSREEVERTLAAARLYVRNESFDEALAILRQHRVCIISGLPGIGKTTLARMLLLYFVHRKFDVVKITGDISEARSVGYHNRPRFYYYDDFLGQTGQADKLNKNEDQRLLDFIASVRDSKDSVLVLTTREYILNQAKLNYEKLARERFDHRTCVIDLSKYSRRIRSQILYNHLHFSALPKAHLEALVANRGYVQIVDHKNYNPRLIEYLTDSAWIGDIAPTDYVAHFLRKLDNPVEIWEHAFRNQLSARARHLLFVLTTLPAESRMSDVEKSFISFHNAECSKHAIARSASDFNDAIKELDGTFLATRRVQDVVLVRFQNPSIRDFMKFVLLSGEMLQDLITSLVFFEQAQLLAGVLDQKKPDVDTNVLRSCGKQITHALRRLLKAEACKQFVDLGGSGFWFGYNQPIERLAFVARTTEKLTGTIDKQWVDSVLLELSKNAVFMFDRPAIFDALRVLRELDCLRSKAGTEYIEILKVFGLVFLKRVEGFGDPEKRRSLHSFEIAANLMKALPRSFTPTERREVREAFEEFIGVYVFESDDSDPEGLRDEASRVARTGRQLKVDTYAIERELEQAATEVEEAEESGFGDDDRIRDPGEADECTDRELDSMFRTLG
jgi:hypothetical protein